MDILNNLLFWLHLIGLGLGAVASFGLPVVGRQMPTATAETRPTLFKVAEGMSTLGRAGFAILIVTGPLLVWLKFGGTSGFTGMVLGQDDPRGDSARDRDLRRDQRQARRGR